MSGRAFEVICDELLHHPSFDGKLFTSAPRSDDDARVFYINDDYFRIDRYGLVEADLCNMNGAQLSAIGAACLEIAANRKEEA